jgi:hypothetical protein
MRRLACAYQGRCEGAQSVKSDPVIDDLLCLEPVGDFMQIDGLLFQGSPRSFDEDTVKIAPPSTHRDFDVCLGQSRYLAAPVYWLPWSVFIISGFLYLAIASSSASTQKLASSAFESCHVSHAFYRLPFPCAHLRWVELALDCNLLNRPVSAQRLKRHSGLKLV